MLCSWLLSLHRWCNLDQIIIIPIILYIISVAHRCFFLSLEFHSSLLHVATFHEPWPPCEKRSGCSCFIFRRHHWWFAQTDPSTIAQLTRLPSQHFPWTPKWGVSSHIHGDVFFSFVLCGSIFGSKLESERESPAQNSDHSNPLSWTYYRPSLQTTGSKRRPWNTELGIEVQGQSNTCFLLTFFPLATGMTYE